jgi:ABC-type antimicrobial peptide transport system permease subunit
VVGVAADVRSGNLGSDSRPEFYVPLRQTPGYVWDQTGGASLSLVVRARRDPSALADALRRAVADVDADLPVYDLMTMDDIRRSAVAPSRFNGLLLTALGLVGLALALVGIFGVVSYFVTQRTQEIGLRMALGATPGRVLRRVLGQALKPVALGLVLGLAGAALVGRSLAGWLYGIEPAEPGTFAVLVAFLSAAALLAAWAPARRATGVDPSRALAP